MAATAPAHIRFGERIYFRWWFTTTIEAAVPVGYLTGTPLLNIYLRLMGAKIGPNVHLDSDTFAIYDLLTIGEDSSINADSNLLGYTDRGRPVEDRSASPSASAASSAPGAPCARTPSWRTTLPSRTCRCCRAAAVIPRGETWLGSPARESRAGVSPAPLGQRRRPNPPGQPHSRRFAFGILHAIGLLIFPVLVVSALFPGIVVMNKLNYLDPYYWYLLLAPLVGLSFIVLAGPGNRRREMAAAGQGEARAATRCTASTTCANGLWIRRWT